MQRGLLVDLATDIIKLVGSLSPVPPVDDVGLRQRFIDLLTEFHARGVRAGYATDQVDAARFALVALIDERVTSTDAAIATTWKAAPLQKHLFGENDPASAFHERLAVLRPPASPERADVLDVFHLCLCYGFRGRLAGDDEAARRLITALAEDVLSARGGVHATLSPGWEPSGSSPQAADPCRWCGLPVWAVPLMLMGGVLLCWLAAYLWTGAAITRFANDFPVR